MKVGLGYRSRRSVAVRLSFVIIRPEQGPSIKTYPKSESGTTPWSPRSRALCF